MIRKILNRYLLLTESIDLQNKSVFCESMKSSILNIAVLMMFALCGVASADQSGDFSYWANATDVTIYAYTGSGSSITVPDTINGLPVRTIADSTFYNNSSFTNIIISSNVTTLGNNVFYQCYGLRSIIIPSSVTSIGYYEFQNCSNLTNISIPTSVTNVGSSLFYGCSSLKKITNSLVYVNVTSGVWITGRDGNLGATVIIPAAIEGLPVTRIADSAFSGFSQMTSISFPATLTAIDGNAFQGCASLISVSIPNAVTSIGDFAFYGCVSLKYVGLPSSLTTLGACTFVGCSSLLTASIPNGGTSIENGTFQNCGSLKSVSIPNSVTSIGAYAFNNCNSLTSVSIPNSVSWIGSSAFNSCGNLSSISIPDSVVSFGSGVFIGAPLANIKASSDMKAFLVQNASALGITNLINQGANNNPTLTLSDLSNTGVLYSIATNPAFVAALAGQITQSSNNYGISAQGIAGPQGPAGATGPQGLIGLTGPVGPQGPTGVFDPTVLTNTAFLNGLASNSTFLLALSNQVATLTNNLGIATKGDIASH